MLDHDGREIDLAPEPVCEGAGGPGVRPGRRLAEEIPVALTFNGATQAVMMASPADLEDFGIGFALAEGVVADPAEISAVEVVPLPPLGLEVRMRVDEACGGRLAARRRRLAGPVGCGLCGIESVEEAVRAPREVARPGRRFRAADVARALAALEAAQRMHRLTQAMHAAALWHPEGLLLALREDVGRHNALDKLVGAAARAGVPAREGIAVVTSRVSVDLVQKASVLGAPVLVAISAPTGLAVRTAEACGLTLVAVARGESFEVFSHPERIAGR